MSDAANNVAGFKPLPAVLERDDCWQLMGNPSLEQHHQVIAEYSLHASVPAAVAQHYQNARNTWLYSFFSYRLLQVALLQVHVAGEAAIKERARAEGIDLKRTSLEALMDIALEKRWLVDSGFEITASRAEREAEHIRMLVALGIDHEPFVGPVHDQDYARNLLSAFRRIRNGLAHGEVHLEPNLGWAFLAVRDLINQLFPVK